ncbi:HalOD1 output domain-containing protein [Halobaculum sp. EA56]|uniref:HalOD1 output domain-containing protein n=1 Tax=Halobaculum sp. EA56 TaxID=3421648 RepID=UPI003EB70EE3
MSYSSTNGSGSSTGLVVDIVETLEEYGLDQGEYQLHNSVDIEAIEQLFASSDGNVAVHFPVEGVHLAVTPDSIEVLSDESTGSTAQ